MKVSLFLFLALATTLAFAAAKMVDLGEVLKAFPYGIIMVLVSLEIFTRMIVSTRVMEVAAVRLSKISKADQTVMMILFSLLLFLTSALVNNITAVTVLLPIIFVLLQAMKFNPEFGMAFFSLFLAASNLAGAATPIGDFPAIIIMKSGLTTFTDYLYRAFPLFLVTTVVVVLIHLIWQRMRQESKSEAENRERALVVHFLELQHKNFTIKWSALTRIGLVFTLMFIAWSLLPAEDFPPEMVALMGLAFAALLLFRQGTRALLEPYPLASILTIGPFLLLATVAQQLGILDVMAEQVLRLENYPTALLIVMMFVTALLTGIFSAGPTAAAMMPVVIKVAAEVFPNQSHWLAVAFAASICAGSSLFITSASAGPLLVESISNAKLITNDGSQLKMGFARYARYGLLHFAIQLCVGVAWVVIFMHP